MSDSWLPPELQVEDKPLPKITRTLISRKPKEQGFILAGILILVCTLVSLSAWENESFFELMASSGDAVFVRHEYYRLFSALFLHGDLGHLMSNAYMLFFLCIFVFGNLTFGFIEACALFLILLFGGGAVNHLTLYSYPPQVRLLGISGFVYLLAGFWFVNFLLIDRRRRFLSRLLRVIGVSLVVLFPTTFEENVSYLAHFHGFWLGFVIGGFYFFARRKKIRSFEEWTLI